MKIFIDPGHNHSGGDTGAAGFGLREQDVTYGIASALKPLLTAAGHEVKMSRNAPTDSVGKTVAESINGRVRMANEWGAELFVSLHANAGGGTGCEVLVYRLFNQAHSIARRICDAVCARLGLEKRGVKARPDLGVLRGTNCPSVLVETAFIDREADADKLKNRQSDFAAAIFEAITGDTCDSLKEGLELEKIAELEARLARLENKMVYNYIDQNMPEWARPTVQKLSDRGILKGDDNGGLGLTDETLRVLVVLDRAGAFAG